MSSQELNRATLAQIRQAALAEIPQADSPHQLALAKAKYLGRQGKLTILLHGLPDVSPAERPQLGSEANRIKKELEALVDHQQRVLDQKKQASWEREYFDVTAPPQGTHYGGLHIITQTLAEIETIFRGLGYGVVTGPEVETEYYNFEALNIPADHPARDMHDTFYFASGKLLRTHTSPVQVHVMEHHAPPLAVIVPGRVYRRDADATHSPVFHQIEGLLVGSSVTFLDLKGTLTYFLQGIFGKNVSVRFRPSYFPFTEPSAEVDVQCFLCVGKGCSLCKQTGWLEILGAGMVDPNVFCAVHYDPEKVSGFAFGLGVERIAMLKYGIQDIRLFYENDVRFLRQFS